MHLLIERENRRMENKYLWSDGWWIDNNEAWFIDPERSVLLKLDLNIMQCDFVVELPIGKQKNFRSHPKCIKVNDEIYCMPYNNNNILVYQLKKNKFIKIKLDTLQKENAGIYNFELYDKEIFAVSIELNKIISINTEDKYVVKMYDLSENVSASTLIGSSLFIVSSERNKIFQFDLKQKRLIEHIINVKSPGFKTICFDGEKVWLTGYKKEIYIWDLKNNSIQTITAFPKCFSLYDTKVEKGFVQNDFEIADTPIFLYTIYCNGIIWFIPFQTNLILYIHKNSKQLNIFEIENEDETPKSLLGRELCHKYLFEYKMEDRYIGLFSLKNNTYFQIDTLENTYKKINFSYSKQYQNEMLNVYINNQALYREQRFTDRLFFSLLLKRGKNSQMLKTKESIGEKIFYSV